MSKDPDYKPSGIPTLDASENTYQFEKARKKHFNDDEILREYHKTDGKLLPDNLEYIDDIYDSNTGTSGTAFRNKDTGKIIVAYTGTNPESDFFNDIVKSDGNSILFGRGTHYEPAFEFYEKMRDRFGAENIILTGHSLGGNVAQRVALKYNAPQTIVYNAAPIFIPLTYALATPKLRASNQKSPFMPDATTSRVRYELNANALMVLDDYLKFTGKITRITTTKDPLNNASDMFGGIYVGDEYVVPHSGGHLMEDLRAVAPYIKDIEAAAISANTVVVDTQTKIQSLQQKREELKVNEIGKGSPNGLSGSELIYLDSEQAKTIADGLVRAAEAGLDLLEGREEIAVEAAKDVYKTLDAPFFLSVLTADEVKAAYAEAGVDYSTTVTKVEEHCKGKIDKAKAIAKTFSDLRAEIQTGVEALSQKRYRISGIDSKWVNGKRYVSRLYEKRKF